MNRDMLSRRLIKNGYELIFAMDGGEAIEIARTQRPDLILMDMGLPTVSGWDATITLKQMTETSAIPIIALTAHALASDQARAREIGCDDYDTKPVDLPRLLDKISRLL